MLKTPSISQTVDNAAGAGNLPCWCGQGQWSEQFRTSRFGLVRCTSCGCFRIDPPPILKDDDSPSFYTEYYSQPGKSDQLTSTPGHRTSRFWRVVKQVPKLGTAGEKVVDIGCGEGHLCADLKDAGWSSVSGLDVSTTRVARAKELYPGIDFYDRPIDETGIPLESVDLEVMDNVIEHLPDPVAMLRNLRCYLKPGGRLVVMTPNMESGNYRLLGRRWTPELAPHAHIFLFTLASLRRLFTMAGFEVEESGNFHIEAYPLREWLGTLASGRVKDAAFSAGQEMGCVYGRLIGEGPMLYVVGRPALHNGGTTPK
jgi:2-polyprenyl-3-methyl-5-hydroxy-6-metoxy-1,4-benzoquinol methylase